MGVKLPLQKMSGTKQQDGQQTATARPTLLYDSKCSICSELAYKARSLSENPLEIVSLTDPEADELLSDLYSEDWEHDFYLVEGNSVRKGKRALPRLSRIVGVKKFSGLVGDYASAKLQSSSHSHDSDCEHAEGSSTLSRRRFSTAMSAVGLSALMPLQKLSDEGAELQSPPSQFTVSVARVEQTNGGYDVSVEERNDLVRDVTATQDRVSEQSDDRARPELITKDRDDLLDVEKNGVKRQVRKTVEDVEPAGVSQAYQDAIEKQDETRTYSITGDHPRYGLGLNLGYGPMVTEDGPTAGATLSGKVNHDVANSHVDFVVFEGTEDAVTHLEGYAEGIRALADYHVDAGRGKMAGLYRSVSNDMRRYAKDFDDVADAEFEVLANHVALSGVPGFTKYVQSPDQRGSDGNDVVEGYDCDCSCSCGPCCGCYCGCGCGVCGCSCDCFCCCEYGCGCGCGCCG